MTELKVKRLDSPLARRTPSADQTEQERPAPATPRPQPAVAAKPALTSVPKAKDKQQHNGPDASGITLGALPDPPPLSEQLELLSTRLPFSLRRSISELTMALRARSDTRQSQKALPEQEVLAVLIWLAGDPNDSATIQRLGRALDVYRGRRYAAEARTLGS